MVFETTPSGTTARVLFLPRKQSGASPPAALSSRGRTETFYGTCASGFFFGGRSRLPSDARTRAVPARRPRQRARVVAGSRYTTELTLASRATVPVQVELKYTASVGAGTGSVSAEPRSRKRPGSSRTPSRSCAGQGLANPRGRRFRRHASRQIRRPPACATAHSSEGARTRREAEGTFGVFYPAAATTTHGDDAVGLQQERHAAIQPRSRQRRARLP